MTRTMAMCAVALTLCGCEPLTEGCKATGVLDANCGVKGDGAWDAPPAGFTIEELDTTHEDSRAAAEALVESASAPRSMDVATLAARDLDGLDAFLVNRFLLHYSGKRRGKNDCRAVASEAALQTLLTSRNAAGDYRYIKRGGQWTFVSTKFKETLVDAELRAELKADFSAIIGDAAKAEAALNAAMRALSEKASEGVTAGTYRYLTLTNVDGLFSELASKKLLVPKCSQGDVDVAIGMVVVAVNESRLIAKDATGADFTAKLGAAVELPKEILDQLDAAVAAELSVRISKLARSTLEIELDRPAVVPLRWKHERIRQTDGVLRASLP